MQNVFSHRRSVRGQLGKRICVFFKGRFSWCFQLYKSRRFALTLTRVVDKMACYSHWRIELETIMCCRVCLEHRPFYASTNHHDRFKPTDEIVTSPTAFHRPWFVISCNNQHLQHFLKTKSMLSYHENHIPPVLWGSFFYFKIVLFRDLRSVNLHLIDYRLLFKETLWLFHVWSVSMHVVVMSRRTSCSFLRAVAMDIFLPKVGRMNLVIYVIRLETLATCLKVNLKTRTCHQIQVFFWGQETFGFVYLLTPLTVSFPVCNMCIMS